jgi:hypothetical protein
MGHDFALGNDRIHADIVRLRMYRLQLRFGIADADAVGSRRGRRQRAIEVTAAVAETKAARIEADQRRDEHVGLNRLAKGGNGYVPDAAVHLHARLPAAELERCGFLHDHGQRDAAAASEMRLRERPNVDLAADRPVDSDDVEAIVQRTQQVSVSNATEAPAVLRIQGPPAREQFLACALAPGLDVFPGRERVAAQGLPTATAVALKGFGFNSGFGGPKSSPS